MRVSVVNTHVDRCGLRLRVHARPKYLRLDGHWRPVREVVSVTRDEKRRGSRKVANARTIT